MLIGVAEDPESDRRARLLVSWQLVVSKNVLLMRAEYVHGLEGLDKALGGSARAPWYAKTGISLVPYSALCVSGPLNLAKSQSSL